MGSLDLEALWNLREVVLSDILLCSLHSGFGVEPLKPVGMFYIEVIFVTVHLLLAMQIQKVRCLVRIA